MALFKILRGSSENFTTDLTQSSVSPAFHDGYCYFIVDTGLFYVDYKNDDKEYRIPLNAGDAKTLLGATLEHDILRDSEVEIPSSALLYAIKNAIEESVASLEARKANKITGSPNQLVGFDDEGNFIAKDSAKPDWNQNDETAPDYIENRPFYTPDAIETVLLEETTVDFLSTGPVNNPFILSEIVKGQTYNVIWDGVLYECVAYIASGPNAPSIGNGSIANMAGGGNEPFFIAIFNGSVLAFVSEAGTHTISISSTINQEIVKLPSKYLQNSNIINGEGSGSLKTIGATKASGQYSFAEGYNTTASKEYSHAEGQKTTASAIAAHAEGISNTASGQAAHAEGYHTTANGLQSHAEGYYTTGSGMASHAEGQETTASATAAHAEGYNTTASSMASHAEGNQTKATGAASHAEGYGTTASGDYSHVQGKYNINDSTLAHIVGNGTSNSKRSNVHTLDWNGNAWFQGDVYIGSNSGTNKDEGSVKLQCEIKGAENQVVGFDADGNAVAVDANANIINYDNTASSLSATNVQDAIDEIIENAEPIVNIPFVLYASAWSNGVQTVEIEGMSHDKNGILSMGNIATDEHKSAIIDADFEVTQSTNTITFTCNGDIPVIDIPLQITMGTIVSDLDAGGVKTFNGRAGDIIPRPGDYTAEMVGALPNSTKIPTKTSELTNDSGFVTSVPTKVSDLTNDSQFVTRNHTHDASYINSGILSTEHGGTGTNTGVQPLIDSSFNEHNMSDNAHENQFRYMNANSADYATRIARLESFLYNDITANPHSMTFENLDGLVVTGIWNVAKAQLEC